MIGAEGGAEKTSKARDRCAWAKFRELAPILTSRGASLKAKGKIYNACVRSVMVYGSETWAMRVEDMHRLERTERIMVRWMSGVTLKDLGLVMGFYAQVASGPLWHRKYCSGGEKEYTEMVWTSGTHESRQLGVSL